MTKQYGGIQSTTAALKNVLMAQGASFSEPMLLGISGGLGAGYILWEFKSHSSATIVMGFRNRWNYQTERLMTLCERLGAKATQHESSSVKAAEKALQTALDTGKPFIAWVDKAHLPHQHLPESLKGYITHVLGVHGEDGDNICVDDLGTELYAVPKNTFATARARIGSDKNRLLLVEKPDSTDLKTAVQTGIDDHIGHLSSDSESFSLPVYKKWAKLLTDPKNKKGWPTVFKDRNGLYATLRSVYEGVIVDGTEGNGLRAMYAEFLSDSANILHNPGLKDAAAAYEKAGQLWREFGESALDDKALSPTKVLLQQRYEAIKHNQVDKVKAVGDEIAQLNSNFERDFPLDAAGVNKLFENMQTQLMAVHDAEVAALDTLKSAIGS